ncbi:MAG: PAS domain S-box protein, partial [Candidatus Schekmanbacteria bacterium]
INIIDIDSHTILLSSRKDSLGKKIDENIRKAISALQKNPSKINIEFIRNSKKKHFDMFIIQAIGDSSKSKEIKYAASSHIEAEEFINPMLEVKDYLGKSVEVILATEEGQNLTSLKFLHKEKNTSKCLKKIIDIYKNKSASHEENAFVEAKGYRDIPVFAVCRPISLTPENNIWLIVKEDRNEALGYFSKRLFIDLAVSVISFILISIFLFFIIKKIVSPLESLSYASEKAREGNLDVRVPIKANDEIGTLSQQFNSMLDTIEKTQKSLEKKIEERTASLSETNKKLLDEIERHHITMKSLKEKEAHLQAIMDYSPSIIYLKDLEGRYILANKKFYDLPRFKGNKEKLIGTKAKDHMPQDIAEEIEKAEIQVRTTGKVIRTEIPVRQTKNEKWLLSTKFPLRDASGKIYGTCTFIDDISERKRFENIIQEREAQLRAVIDNSPALIFIKDVEGKYLMINSQYEKNFNIKQSEIVGKTDFELFSKETAEKIFENDRKVINEKIAIKKEESVEQADGIHTYISVKFPLYDFSGKVYALCGISTDITDEKAKEAELRLLATAISQTNECIVITDKDANIQYVNPAFQRTTGYSPNEVLGLNPRILQSGEHSKEFYENMWNTLTSGKTWEGEFINKRKNGQIYYEEASISPVFDSSGKIINYVGVKRDVTDSKMKEEQLLQSQKMESVGRLAGGVAHDFNNILVGILGYSELILTSIENNSEVKKYAEEIRNAGERASALTRQLLAFSRKQVIEPKIINLNQLIENIRNMLSRIIGEDIEIRLKLQERGLGTIKVDPDQMAQVLLNLAVNARDAMAKGGKIVIKTSNVELEKKYIKEEADVISGKFVLLSFADTGIGMDKETQKKIFEPFFTTKKEGKGTGLGLSTVYGVVKQSGGYITVHSRVGKGTVFKIFLPRVDVKEISDIVDVVEEAEASIGFEKVLVVEDEETVRELTREIMSSKGYRVDTAETPEEALEKAGNGAGPFDLLITDLIMPGMDGIELSKKIKERNPSIKTLVMSGYSDNEFLRNGGLKGNIPYIQKPFTPQALLKKVREVLNSK